MIELKEIKQDTALVYVAQHLFPDLNPEKEGLEGAVEKWINFRGFMNEAFLLKGNQYNYRGKYLELFKVQPRWWVGLYDNNKIVGVEYFTFRGNKMFSGFLYADTEEYAKEIVNRLYEQAKVTLPKLHICESVHISTNDDFSIQFREDTGYRAWGWIDDKDVKGNDCRISFLKKLVNEWEEEKKNDKT